MVNKLRCGARKFVHISQINRFVHVSQQMEPYPVKQTI